MLAISDGLLVAKAIRVEAKSLASTAQKHARKSQEALDAIDPSPALSDGPGNKRALEFAILARGLTRHSAELFIRAADVDVAVRVQQTERAELAEQLARRADDIAGVAREKLRLLAEEEAACAFRDEQRDRLHGHFSHLL